MPNSWKSWVKPWVPPIVVDLYRKSARRSRPHTNSSAHHHNADVPFLLPVRGLGDIFPGIETTEASVLFSQVHDGSLQWEMTLPMAELLSLAAMCKYAQPRKIFEIGTFMGSSTLAMAVNTPPDAEIFTLDLEPTSRDTHEHGLGVGGIAPFEVGAYFQNTPFASKIRQIFGNSVTYDYTPFLKKIDLVVVDGDHSYKFVKSDSENAFKLLRPGGMILWDDYVWNPRHPECAGVAQFVNELKDTGRAFRIAGTRFAIYVDG